MNRFFAKHPAILMLLTALLSGCAGGGDINEWRNFSHADTNRQYHLYVPDGLLATNDLLPMVINLHGSTPAPSWIPTFGSFFQQVITGMPTHAAQHDYVVVHPQGRLLGDTQYWVTSDASDTGFINALVTFLTAELPIDPDRVFLTGFSSGGILTWKLACEHSERYAAIAPVAANRRAAMDCPGSRPVPVMGFHGTEDPTVAYSGGRYAMESWAAEHGCQQQEVFFQEADSTCERWHDCNNNSEMLFCSSEGAGHTWPSGPGSIVISAAGYGKTSYTLDATDRIWAFFDRVSTAVE
ncbi:MAG: hypothetical protein R3208_09970 [Ketobacteraceae bacterium]|nr:hypothetical protein [Ketobacteraceae bacterium]